MSRISIANSQVQHQMLGHGVLRLHGSAVLVDGAGVLVLGAPGLGKSTYVAYLMQAGGQLIADDQVLCTQEEGACLLSPPNNIAGVLAVRGLGLIKQPYAQAVPLERVIVLSPNILHGARALRLFEVDAPCSYNRLPTGAYYSASQLFDKAKRDGNMLSDEWMPKVA